MIICHQLESDGKFRNNGVPLSWFVRHEPWRADRDSLLPANGKKNIFFISPSPWFVSHEPTLSKLFS